MTNTPRIPTGRCCLGNRFGEFRTPKLGIQTPKIKGTEGRKVFSIAVSAGMGGHARFGVGGAQRGEQDPSCKRHLRARAPG